MNKVTFGDIPVFEDISFDKKQALKILEEAAEVFGAWQNHDKGVETQSGNSERDILDECCDVVTAVANLCSAMGYRNMVPFMEDCLERNIERGRVVIDS